MKSVILSLFLIISINAAAADKEYAVSEIPASLTKNANLVVRFQETKVVVQNPGSVTQKEHFVMTVLNENGSEDADLLVFYDKLQKVSNIKGVLYDAGGNVLKKLKSKEVKDVSAVDDGNLFDDSRVKIHSFAYQNYPYTVEYEYEVNMSHSFFLPGWIPQTDESTAVQKSIFEVEVPGDFAIRYRVYNINEPETEEVKGRKSFRWQIKDVPVLKSPGSFSDWTDFQTAVFIAPNDFKLNQYKGNMETWKGLGAFTYQLIEGKDVLPEKTRTKVRELTGNLTGEKEKIEKLYEYLQENTRYISIQLGIGGWQPFDAGYVDKNGYGDCKALTNFMKSLLKEAGITAYYTLVNAGRSSFAQNRVIESFPSNRFNHVILCVPGESDTTWLECTSQILPAGYLGGSTGNRKALVVKKDGGVLVSTPQYKDEKNKAIRSVNIKVDKDGAANILSDLTLTGLQQDAHFYMVKSQSQDDIKKTLSRTIPLPSFELNNFNYNVIPSSVPEIKEELDISAVHFATVTGKRMFVTPNIFSKYSSRIETEEDRKSDFAFNRSYLDSDTIEIDIPEGYALESGIRPVALDMPFGKYEMTCKVAENKIFYTRTFEQREGRFTADRQKDIVDFYNQIYKADRARLVLVNEKD